MGHDPTKKQVLVPIVRGTLRLQVACFWLSYCCWKVLAPPRRERTATAEPCPAAGLGSCLDVVIDGGGWVMLMWFGQ